MIRKYLLPLIALFGALFGLVTVYWTQKTVPTAPILFPPAESPYPHAIAASGVIEASSQNIAIGCPFNEVIQKVFVTEGDKVKAGAPLFQLDLRAFQAQLMVAEAQLRVAVATRDDKRTQFSFYEQLKDRRAVSEQIYQQALYAALEAEENITVAKASVEVAKINIERATILAPVDGEILQLNIHVGEIAPIIPTFAEQSNWMTTVRGSLLLMGKVDPLQLRVDIDEEDAWRAEKGAVATAFVRGNSAIHFPLTFLRIEPYIVPKLSLTGAAIEMVDTRVLQVLYLFERKELPVYPGQVLDVFIQTSQPNPPSSENL